MRRRIIQANNTTGIPGVSEGSEVTRAGTELRYFMVYPGNKRFYFDCARHDDTRSEALAKAAAWRRKVVPDEP
jgi:hypothetical protein